MDYSNPAECLGVLKSLDVNRPEQAYAVLSDMLSILLETSPAPNQHLEVLEATREPLARVQEGLAQGYVTQPLPPGTRENHSLDQVVSLWKLMAHSYAHVTRRDAASGTLDDQRALLSQRRVFYTGQVPLEYFRARRELPRTVWSMLLKAYSMAEAQGVARIRVADSLNVVWHAQSASEAFIAVLLVDLASPYSRSRRELEWVCRWAQRFAPYCRVDESQDSPADDSTSKVYGLDLNADHGLRPLGTFVQSGSANRRRFESGRLAGQIQAVVTQFKQGTKPAALGLGENTPVDACVRLLISLYRPWGLGSAGRRFARRGARGHAELSGDWLSIGFHVQGHLFTRPDEAPAHAATSPLLPRANRDAVADHGTTPERKRTADELGFTCERWQIVDQSVGGFRLRREPSAERLEHHQLVGIRPPDGERFLIGQICWLMYREDGVLEAGVNLLGGLPRVVAVRQCGADGSKRGSYQQGFWLAETPVLDKPASLVLPAGWYHAKRIIELHEQTGAAPSRPLTQLRMTKLVRRGANFDQVRFERLA